MILAYFDGLCQPNPGVGTYGFVIYRDGRKVHEGWGGVGTHTTNNIAEYTGALRALEYLIEQKLTAEAVTVRGDSELVIKQLRGEYKVRDAKLAPLNAKIRELFFRFQNLRYEHVPRERNREADALSNLAYAEVRRGE